MIAAAVEKLKTGRWWRSIQPTELAVDLPHQYETIIFPGVFETYDKKLSNAGNVERNIGRARELQVYGADEADTLVGNSYLHPVGEGTRSFEMNMAWSRMLQRQRSNEWND